MGPTRKGCCFTTELYGHDQYETNPALLKEAPRAAAPTKPAPLERKASSDVIDLSSPPRVRQPFTGAQSAVQTSPLTPRKVALRAAIANKDNHTATQDDRIATQADRAAT